MKLTLPPPRLGFFLLGLAGILLFVGGAVLGNLMHLAACPLCILQRMVYLSLGVIGLAGAIFGGSVFGRRFTGLLFALAAGTGAFIAGYQSWIQHHPDAPSCVADSPWWENFVYWAGEKLPAFFLSSGMCSDPGFKLFGLSIAEYSLLIFSVFLLAALVQILRKR